MQVPAVGQLVKLAPRCWQRGHTKTRVERSHWTKPNQADSTRLFVIQLATGLYSQSAMQVEPNIVPIVSSHGG